MLILATIFKFVGKNEMIGYSNLKHDWDIYYFIGDQFILLRNFISWYNDDFGDKYIII